MVDEVEETTTFLVRFKSKGEIEGRHICASRRGNKITFDIGCQLTGITTENERRERKEEEERQRKIEQKKTLEERAHDIEEAARKYTEEAHRTAQRIREGRERNFFS